MLNRKEGILLRTLHNKWMACLLMAGLFIIGWLLKADNPDTPLPTGTVYAGTTPSAWKIITLSTSTLDKEYPLAFETGGVTFGYKSGKVALMDTYTRKLIKKTDFTEINEIKKNGNNVDAIVVKESKGQRLFGVIDKSGKTLIPASKYKEIFFLNKGFRAVDAVRNNYYILRNGKVLCTYKNGEKVIEYGKYFSVINEKSQALQGTYDYNGTKVTNIPESDQTASNQYYVILNTLLKDLTDKATNYIVEAKNDLIPASILTSYPDGALTKVAANITPVQNCYMIYIREDYNENNITRYSINKDFLFDLKGNLIAMADDIKSFENTKQYVAAISKDKIITIYDTTTGLSIDMEYRDTGDYDYLKFDSFGDYMIMRKCHSYDEGAAIEPTAAVVFGMDGNVVSQYEDCYVDSRFIKADGKYYNQNLKEILVDGELHTSTDGYMILKESEQGKNLVTFTDFNLKKILSIKIADQVVKITQDADGNRISLLADFVILGNGTGVHLTAAHFKYDYAKHYFINRNGTMKVFEDSKSYHYGKVSGNKIIVIKAQKEASVDLGKTMITSAKSSAPGELSVEWKTLKGVTAYHVEITRADNNEYIPKDAKTNSIVMKGLTSGMSYRVHIRAYINRGDGWKVGIYSKEVTVKIK